MLQTTFQDNLFLILNISRNNVINYKSNQICTEIKVDDFHNHLVTNILNCEGCIIETFLVNYVHMKYIIKHD